MIRIVLLLSLLGCQGPATPDGWQLVEEYDPTTGANESVIDRGLAVGLDSASIGFLCIDGEVRLSLYQKEDPGSRWLRPFNYSLAIDGAAPESFLRDDIGREEFQRSWIDRLQMAGEGVLSFNAQMGAISNQRRTFIVTLNEIRQAIELLNGCEPMVAG